MKVFAVIVNWSGGDENLACLRSLTRRNLEQDEIVFVDNGSTDGSLERVCDEYPNLHVIANQENLGFGHGTNQGIELALELGADAVYCINNDVELLPESVERLVQELEERKSVGVIGPRVLYRQDPTSVWCAGGMLTWRQNLSTLLGHRQLDGPRWQGSMLVDYVPGCAMLVRREVFDAIGPLDAEFFAYMEDVDFCVRAREAGFGVFLLGELAVLHQTSSATGGGYNPRRKYMMGVNSIWFLRRHGGPAQWARFLVFDVATLPFLWLKGLFDGRSRAVLGKARGILDGMRGRRVSAESIRAGAEQRF